MDLLKALKKTTFMTAVSVLALGATQANAVEGVDELGHISASVTGALNITEVSAINFGNFAISCTGGTCDTTGNIVLSDAGTRTKTNGAVATITLLNGAGSTDGVVAGSNQETGSQRPGFYTISAGGEGTGTQNVYVSFADSAGNIIDSSHPSNHASITGGVGGTQTFTVDTFTFESDTGTTGYVQQNPSTSDIYGSYVPLVAGAAKIRVGATLHTAVTAANYGTGAYTGTFNIMVAY